MKLLLIRRKAVIVFSCLLIVCCMLYVVNHPAIVGATAAARQLPIYSVQRDYKVVSLSFDAAWGDVIIRLLGPKGSSSRIFRLIVFNPDVGQDASAK